MEKKNQEKSPRQVNYFWVLAGGYLVYLGGTLIVDLIKGDATHVAVSILAAAAFIGVGGAVCLREWRIYRFGSKEEREMLAQQELKDETIEYEEYEELEPERTIEDPDADGEEE